MDLMMIIAAAATQSSGARLAGALAVPFVIGGMVGLLIGMFKGRPGLGFVLGALLGCIGWAIIAFMGKKRYR